MLEVYTIYLVGAGHGSFLFKSVMFLLPTFCTWKGFSQYLLLAMGGRSVKGGSYTIEENENMTIYNISAFLISS